MIKIAYNWIRYDWKLFKWYRNFQKENAKGEPEVYFIADSYENIPKEIIDALGVEIRNETDSMTDYFCKDSFKITQDHKFFIHWLSAIIHRQQKRFERWSKNKKNFYWKDNMEKELLEMKDFFNQLCLWNETK